MSVWITFEGNIREKQKCNKDVLKSKNTEYTSNEKLMYQHKMYEILNIYKNINS